MISILESYDVLSGERKVIAEFPGVIEAPVWMKDGERILYNANGEIYLYRISDGETVKANLGGCAGCNNDHVLSPDEQYLGISCNPDP